MSKFVIVTSPCTDYWMDDYWKENICEDFNSDVVIVGNDDWRGVEEAPWWKLASGVVDAFDEAYDDLATFLDYCPGSISESKLKYIWNKFKDDWNDDTDTRVAIAELLIPGLSLGVSSIYGFCQGDYAEVVYDTSEDINVQRIEDWYFGDVWYVDLCDVDEDALAEDGIEDIYDTDSYSVEDYIDIASSENMTLAASDVPPQWDKEGFADLFGLNAEDIIDIISKD